MLKAVELGSIDEEDWIAEELDKMTVDHVALEDATSDDTMLDETTVEEATELD